MKIKLFYSKPLDPKLDSFTDFLDRNKPEGFMYEYCRESVCVFSIKVDISNECCALFKAITEAHPKDIGYKFEFYLEMA